MNGIPCNSICARYLPVFGHLWDESCSVIFTPHLVPHQVFIYINKIPLSFLFSRLGNTSSLSTFSYELLQYLDHLCVPCVTLLGYMFVSLFWGDQTWTQHCRGVSPVLNSGEGWPLLNCRQCFSLVVFAAKAHGQYVVHQNPQFFFFKAAFQPFGPILYCDVWGYALPHTRLSLDFIKIPVRPFLQLCWCLHNHLVCQPFLWILHTCKLPQGALCPIIQVTKEDVANTDPNMKSLCTPLQRLGILVILLYVKFTQKNLMISLWEIYLLWQTLYWISNQCKWSLQKVSLQWVVSVVTEKMGYIGSWWTSEIYTFLLQCSILRWFHYKSHYLNGKLCFTWDTEKDTLDHWSIFFLFLWHRTISKFTVYLLVFMVFVILWKLNQCSYQPWFQQVIWTGQLSFRAREGWMLFLYFTCFELFGTWSALSFIGSESKSVYFCTIKALYDNSMMEQFQQEQTRWHETRSLI